MKSQVQKTRKLISQVINKDQFQLLSLLNRPLSGATAVKEVTLPEAFWDIAERNRLGALLAESLQGGHTHLVPAVRSAALEEQEAKLDVYLKELCAIGAVFHEVPIPVIVLENGGLAYGVHRVPANYSFGDFDLLLAFSDLRHARRLLLERGYRCLTGSDAENTIGFDLSAGRLEFQRQIAPNLMLTLNLQTTLVARRWFFSGKEPDFAALLQRSLSPHSGFVRILGREDFLFQLCVHNAAHSYLRSPGIRLHLDVDWYLRCVGEEINWHNFIGLVTAMKAKTVAYFSLLIPQVILGSPVPEEVLSALAPGGWKTVALAKILGMGNLLSPQQRQFRRWAFFLFNLLIHDDLSSFARTIVPSREHLISCCGLIPKRSGARFLFKHYLKAVQNSMSTFPSLIVFSGIDGAGKSTQIAKLSATLADHGRKTVCLWSRGGYTPIFHAVKVAARRILGKKTIPTGRTEARTKAFNNGWVQTVWLTLALIDLGLLYGIYVRWLRWSGRIVIADRYLHDTWIDFTLNFPASGFHRWFLWKFVDWITPFPDHSFLLLIPVEDSLIRSRQKFEPFPDSEETLRQRLNFYHQMGENGPWQVIDCLRSIEDISQEIRSTVFAEKRQ